MIPNDYRTYDEAVRGEVTDRLAGFSHANYNDAQVQYLAARLIMPRSNGTFTGSSEPTELIELCLELGVIPTIERVPCSVPWCSGHPYSHGGDGRAPADYEHSSDPDNLAPGGMLHGYFEQLANMPPFYRFDSSPAPKWSDHLLTVSEVRKLAEQLEQSAALLRTRATQLEEFGGLQ